MVPPASSTTLGCLFGAVCGVVLATADASRTACTSMDTSSTMPPIGRSGSLTLTPDHVFADVQLHEEALRSKQDKPKLEQNFREVLKEGIHHAGVQVHKEALAGEQNKRKLAQKFREVLKEGIHREQNRHTLDKKFRQMLQSHPESASQSSSAGSQTPPPAGDYRPPPAAPPTPAHIHVPKQ